MSSCAVLSCWLRLNPNNFRSGRRTEQESERLRKSAPTFTPLSLRKGVLEGGIGVLFPEGLNTLGAEVLLNGACFGIPLSGA